MYIVCSLFGHLWLHSRSQGRQHINFGVSDLSVAPAVSVTSKRTQRQNGDVMGQNKSITGSTCFKIEWDAITKDIIWTQYLIYWVYPKRYVDLSKMNTFINIYMTAEQWGTFKFFPCICIPIMYIYIYTYIYIYIYTYIYIYLFI